MRCLALPIAERAPLLAVLKQLGVRPHDIAGTKYRRLEVRPRGCHIEVVDLSAPARKFRDMQAGRFGCVPTFAAWREVVAHAVKHKAALRSEAPDLSGTFDTRFEHLVGLPQNPMTWEGIPLQLDITEVRANVVVCALHCGDFKPLVPNVLRSLLFAQDIFGVLTVAASGHLVASRRYVGWSTQHAISLHAVLGRLAAHRLITHTTGDAFAAAFPWGALRSQMPVDDLAFALDCLGTHAGLSFPQDEGYQTMWRLAPALLAQGGHFEASGIACSLFAPWRWARLRPWSAQHVNTPLHEIVRNFTP